MDSNHDSYESFTLPEPDIMNDPAFATNSPEKEKGIEDQDTCRICRSEGWAEEPLFYPCRCSGSIKFVHQACLMEWLSHSQKKHCELCKTPFRFTKLYNPQMPKTVPLPVFLRQAAIHALQTLLGWARWLLVAFVWLGWVPWAMRTVWRGLFWLGDGGWANWHDVQKHHKWADQKLLERLASQGTSPAITGLLSSNQAAASSIVSKITSVLPPIWPPVSQTLNFTAGEPMMMKLTKRVFRSIFYAVPAVNTSSMSHVMPQPEPDLRSHSLLSEVQWLQSLTRWRTLNNVLVDVLEGQLITLAVVVIFILIFLIREWVVQQQPAINVPLPPDDQIPAPPPPAEGDDLQDMVAAGPEENPEPVVPANIDEDNGAGTVDAPEPARPRRILPARRPFLPRRASTGELANPDNSNPINTSEHADAQATMESFVGNDLLVSMDESIGEGSSNNMQRPSMLTREGYAQAVEIQRALEERYIGGSDKDRSEVQDFYHIWMKADEDPKEASKLIETEGRQEEFAWIMPSIERVIRELNSDVASTGGPNDTTNHGERLANGQNWPFRDVPLQPETPSGNGEAEAHYPSSPREVLTTEEPIAGLGRPASWSTVSNPESSARNVASIADQDELEHSMVDFLPAPNIEVPDLRDDLGRNQFEPRPDDIDLLAEFGATAEVRADALDEAQAGTQNLEEFVPNPPFGFWERTIQDLWGDVRLIPPDLVALDDEDDHRHNHGGREVRRDAPGAPVRRVLLPIENADDADIQDPEVLRAAQEAGIDINADAMEEGEDMEGVMELIGVQGPIAGLLQNALFSAVLISLVIFGGVWIPYIAGKLFLVILANPVSFVVKTPLRWASLAADVVIDISVFLAGTAYYWLDYVIVFMVTPIGWVIPWLARMNENSNLSQVANEWAWEAAERITNLFKATGEGITDSDIPIFSILAHESLNNLKRVVDTYRNGIAEYMQSLPQEITQEAPSVGLVVSYASSMVSGFGWGLEKSLEVAKLAYSSLLVLLTINPLKLTLDIPSRLYPLDYSLANWDTKDRLLAILLGYMAISLSGATYVAIKRLLRHGSDPERAEGNIEEALYQAAGVMKVILIITIEMIVFPLYCGILLDVALLPLFKGQSIGSRFVFTRESPFTSIFVHWFVGTCYMFHFALFVSMCRKILRTGVLYFIRDPDDPTFHPVRDVLERSVVTQLRKIAFSAMVYGALVIICLGTVVWSIAYTTTGIFPVVWWSDQPVLDFPVDLLAYTFIMPIVVRFFKPSAGLKAMYRWWFRRCARVLRLSDFLFGVKKMDEVGLAPRPNLLAMFKGGEDLQTDLTYSPRRGQERKKISAALAIHGGCYVRAPASDQVRIPKGKQTFVELDENGKRKDGVPVNDKSLHGYKNKQFSTVYIPPQFPLRIVGFITLLWLFAAVTGVAFTVVPLLFGRWIFSYLIPLHLRMNDIYAFALGAYLLGAPVYMAFYYRKHHHGWVLWQLKFSRPIVEVKRLAVHALRLAYFYGAFGIFIPIILNALVELYLLIPIHTYFSPDTAHHTVYLTQGWTLGVLYWKIFTRTFLSNPLTRPTNAFRALTDPHNRGNTSWNPDIRLANRGFIYPAAMLGATLILLPMSFAYILTHTTFSTASDNFKLCVYRYIYPAALAMVLNALALRGLYRGLKEWRTKIRDEVYLIGERLHNFGEKKAVKGEQHRPRVAGRV